MARCPAGVRTKSVFSISLVCSKWCSQVSQIREVAHCFWAFISPLHYKSPNSEPELPSTTIPINNNNESARHRYPDRMRRSDINDNVTDDGDDDDDVQKLVGLFFCFYYSHQFEIPSATHKDHYCLCFVAHAVPDKIIACSCKLANGFTTLEIHSENVSYPQWACGDIVGWGRQDNSFRRIDPIAAASKMLPQTSRILMKL